MRDKLLEDAAGRGSAEGKARSGLEGKGCFGVTAVASLPSLLPLLSKCRVVMPARGGRLRVRKLTERGRGDVPDVMTARSTRGDLFVDDISNAHGSVCCCHVVKTRRKLEREEEQQRPRQSPQLFPRCFLCFKIKPCCSTSFLPGIERNAGGADA